MRFESQRRLLSRCHIGLKGCTVTMATPSCFLATIPAERKLKPKSWFMMDRCERLLEAGGSEVSGNYSASLAAARCGRAP